MRMIIRRGTAVAAVTGAALLLTAGAAYPDPPPAARTASVTGSAEFALPTVADDDVRSFTFDARAEPYSRPLPLPGLEQGSPTDAVGTVEISHWVADLDVTVTAEAEVDCLVTGPHHATLTAVVTRADDLAKDMLGDRVGFSIYDGGRDTAGRTRDRVGFTWVLSLDQDDTGAWGAAATGTCVAPAAFAPVTRGGYTVRHAELVAPPAGS